MDIPRKVTLTSPDGKREDAMVLQSSIDLETGEHKVMNDLRTAQFDVFAEIGTAYESQKQQQRQELKELIASTPPDQPIYPALLYKYVMLGDGVDDDDMKDWCKKQLLLSGFKEPDTDEEKQIVADAQNQAQQPDANMVLAQAEQMKAQVQGEKVKVDYMNAETNRIKAITEAKQAGINIEYTEAKKTGQQIENLHKLRNPPKSNHEPVAMQA
jgi:hypothetical protein